MSTIRAKPKSVAGPLLLLIVLLVDVGLIIWAWHLYQRKKETYDSAGLSLSKAPDVTTRTPLAASPARHEPESPLRNIVREHAEGGKAAKARRTGARRPVAGDRRRSREERRRVWRAVKFYYALKRRPKFKNSKVIREWKEDFLSHPDLRAINKRYLKDRNAVRFVVDMVASPNFRTMFKEHIMKPDMQTFIKEMATSEEVKESAGSFMEDTNIAAMVKNLELAQQASAGEAAAAAENPGGADALDRLRNNPKLKPFLEQQ